MNSSQLILKQVELGPMMNFIYIIGCNQTREAAVVDPAWETRSIIKIAEESDLKITKILLTHSHPDHMNALEEVLEATEASVYVHRDEEEYMRLVADHFRLSLDFLSRPSTDVYRVNDGEEIPIGKLTVRSLHTPGHTPGSQCFLVDNRLISGDTLFNNACGRIDLPGGDPEKMWASLNKKLKKLDDSVLVYPGHNYGARPTSTIGEEKFSNPYLQHATLENFLQFVGGI